MAGLVVVGFAVVDLLFADSVVVGGGGLVWAHLHLYLHLYLTSA